MSIVSNVLNDIQISIIWTTTLYLTNDVQHSCDVLNVFDTKNQSNHQGIHT
jgi:hypothetical protein